MARKKKEEVKPKTRKNPKNAGRKGKYKKEWIEWVKEWAREGLMNYEIALRLEISQASLYNYQLQYPEFAEAIKDAKKDANAKIEDSIYRRALGYDVEEIEEIRDELGNVVNTKIKRRHIPGEIRAAQYLLNNRDPENWRDRKEIEHEGKNFIFDVRLVGDEDEEE